MKQITINDYYVHYNDLKSLFEMAEEEKEGWKKKLFLRQLPLKACFALEALTNQMLSKFSKFRANSILFGSLERLSTIEKIANLHEICNLANQPIIKRNEHLFSQIKELFKIRNQWVHGKNESLIHVEQDGEMGWVDSSGNDLGEFPYLKVPVGLCYNKATKIPINPFELKINHGKLCIQIVDNIEQRISRAFQLPKDKIHSLDLYDEYGNKMGDYPIDKVWGIYTPAKNNCPE